LRWIFILLMVSLIFTGCAQTSKQNTKSQAQSTTQQKQKSECNSTPIRHLHSEKSAEFKMKQTDGVDSSVAVYIDNELYVAVEVSNFDRLRLKTIRQEGFKKLKTSFPNSKIHVTTDSKVYSELEKLSNKEWNSTEACKQKKELKKIEKLMKG
jgi:ABC-type Fe3+-hydroxamate transport system substrate-binding protein